ncbi:MAG: COX15/CtaA family protein [Acidimicrobiales bacterium]
MPPWMRLSPRAYRQVTLVALLLLAAIIVSGGAVRVTGSGLGCPDWPTCDQGRLAPQLFEQSAGHATIEYVNRLVTGLVSVVVIVAVLGSLARTPRRRDLTWLSLGLVGGVVGQIVLGGITVLTGLHPVAVQSHFLLSLVIVTCAVVLHRRAGREPAPAGAPPPAVAPSVRSMSRLTLGLLVPAIVAGTVLTGTGPHGGDPTAPRFAFDPRRVAQVHGVLVEVFTAALLATLVLAWRRHASRNVLRRGSVAVAVAAAQSALGYTQYFTGVPAALVGLHILGATTLWIAVLRWHLGLDEWLPRLAPPVDREAAPSLPAVAVSGSPR